MGKRIIETRLLIKESGNWNVATYLWDEAQADANLELNGVDTQVEWTTANGDRLSTLYHVPTENECMTCHQSKSSMTPLGPRLRNLNRTVERNGTILNQISHLQAIGMLNSFPLNEAPEIVDYNDPSRSLAERGRAYLDMNCSHCHNPDGWSAPNEREFDFRYETAFEQTGISFEEDKIVESLVDQEMPLIGTTLMDQEGVNLIMAYMESL